jgi:hypothetical protein
MRFILSLSILLLHIYVEGQQLLDAEGFQPEIGSQFILHTVKDPQLTFDSNSTFWDASSLIVHRSQAVSITDPSLSPFKDEFPRSNLCYSLGSGSYIYAELNEQGYLKHGGVAGETGLIMSNPELYLKFPLKLGAQWSDSLSSEFSTGNIDFERTGKIEGKVLGQGTLIMPYGILQEVFMLSITEKLTDHYKMMGTPMQLLTENEIICFLKAGNIEPILTCTQGKTNGDDSSSYATYIDSSSVQSTGNTGPWHGLTLITNADGRKDLQFISEFNGEVEIRLLDEQGKQLHNIYYVSVSAGAFSFSIPGFTGQRYLELSSVDQVTLVKITD